MRRYRVTVYSEHEDGERVLLGLDTVDAGSAKEARRLAVERHWDPRLEAASCKPVVLVACDVAPGMTVEEV